MSDVIISYTLLDTNQSGYFLTAPDVSYEALREFLASSNITENDSVKLFSAAGGLIDSQEAWANVVTSAQQADTSAELFLTTGIYPANVMEDPISTEPEIVIESAPIDESQSDATVESAPDKSVPVGQVKSAPQIIGPTIRKVVESVGIKVNDRKPVAKLISDLPPSLNVLVNQQIKRLAGRPVSVERFSRRIAGYFRVSGEDLSAEVQTALQLLSQETQVTHEEYIPEKAQECVAEEQVQRHFATCDNCQSGIVGIRYKCLHCPDYDLCQTCETNSAGIHDANHVFAKIVSCQQRLPRNFAGSQLFGCGLRGAKQMRWQQERQRRGERIDALEKSVAELKDAVTKLSQ